MYLCGNRTSPDVSGQGLGMEQASMEPLLEPVLTYEVKLPQGCDKAVMLPKLRELEEEDPQLHVAWTSTFRKSRCSSWARCRLRY